MKKKLFVIKNTKTGMYFSGNSVDDRCRAKNLVNAEFFNERRVGKEFLVNYAGLYPNEKFVEVEIREKKRIAPPLGKCGRKTNKNLKNRSGKL